MYRVILIIIFVAAFSVGLSQNSLKEFRNLVDNGDLLEASKLIEQVVRENRDNSDVYIETGDVYFEMEKFNDAMKMYEEANKRERRSVKIMNKIAFTYAKLDNFPESFDLFRKSIERDKKNFESYLLFAEAYLLADSLKEAEIKIQQAQDIDKKDPRAFIALGDLYFAQRVYLLARENYENALSIDPNNLDAKMKLATSYYWLANREADQELANELFNRSLSQWNEITKLDPKNSKAFYEQGKILFFSKQYPNAALSLNNFIQLRPNGSLGRWYLAQALYELGRCDSAAPHLKIVSAEIDSVRDKAKLLLARCYLQNENYAKSAETFAVLDTELELELADMRRYGQSLLFSGDTTNALTVWNKAIDTDLTDPSNCKLMYLMGQLTIGTGRYQEGVEILNKRLNSAECSDSTDKVVYYLIGQGHLFSQEYDEAITAFQKSIELDSNMFFSRVYLGDAYAAQEQYDLAEAEFKYVIEYADTNSAQSKSAINQAFAKESGMLLEKKDYNGLNAISKLWIDKFNDSKYALLYYAVSWQGLNEVSNACKYYKEVLKIDPENGPAQQNIKALGCGG